MCNAFITFTPYHMLLAYGLARSLARSQKNELLIIGDSENASTWADLLRTWPKSPFTHVQSLPGADGLGRGPQAKVRVRLNLPEVRRWTRAKTIETLYVFNDFRAETQVAIRQLRRQRRRARCVYIEDGTAAYSSLIRRRSFTAVLLAKCLYGPWWEDVKILGTSRHVDAVQLRFPEHVRSELRTKEVLPFPADLTDCLRSERAFFLEWVERVGWNPDLLASIDGIFILPPSASLGEDRDSYMRDLQRFAEEARKHEFRVAYKPHPLEPLGDFPSLDEATRVQRLPRSLPIEIVYLLASDRLTFVIGNTSTALLTARWLLRPTQEVVSIRGDLPREDLRLLQVFEAVGIRVLKDSTGLSRLLRK